MEEQLISFKTVKLAKEKGIDFRSKEFSKCTYTGKAGTYHAYITQSLLQKHLRETHKIIVQVECNYYDDELGWNTYSVTIFHRTHNKTTECFYRTYEEALEVGLIEALKLIQ